MGRWNPKAQVYGQILLLLSVLAISSVSLAAERYLRAGATGNGSGSDWTNAYTALPATLVRGDTYYIADGSYSGYTFDDAVSGTTRITIKKATIADHGTGVGWQDGFGDGQAVFGPLTFTSGFFTIDGTHRTSWTSGHGIRIQGTAAGHKLFRLNPGANNIVGRYLEVAHRGVDTGTEDDGFYTDSGQVENVTIQFSHFRDFGRVAFFTRSVNRMGSEAGTMLVEHTWVARVSSSDAQHGEGWSDLHSINVVIRYNVWEDMVGTGGIVGGGSGTGSSNTNRNWRIYGNVFWKVRGNIGNGVITKHTINDVADWQIYNNTIIGYNLGNNGPSFHFGGGTVTDVVARNNLFVANALTANHTGVTTLSHNSYYDTPTSDSGTGSESGLTGSPLVDHANGNFRLAVPTTAGFTLLSPYNTDPDGNIRSSDGVWDRGAYEFGGNAGPPPNPPTNLRLASGG